jgi:hypothetical protein
MCLTRGVSVNRALSNLYRQATNLSHYMKWDQEFEKDATNSLPSNYRLLAVGDLDVMA